MGRTKKTNQPTSKREQDPTQHIEQTQNTNQIQTNQQHVEVFMNKKRKETHRQQNKQQRQTQNNQLTIGISMTSQKQTNQPTTNK